jgi:outer membrane receptor for ferrienterochelin and colicins
MSLEELVNVKVVSATRTEATSLHLPSVVTVLSGEELSRWGAENLGDGLRTAAGVQIRKGPGDFPQYSAVIRGNSGDFLNIRTLFMIDGVAVRNPNAGFDPGWIPLSIIKRVEIVKGPASNLYGANAFGGVVNIITKSGADLGTEDGAGIQASVGYRSQNDVIRQEYLPGETASVNVGTTGPAVQTFASGQYSAQRNAELTYPGHEYQDLFGKLRYRVSDETDFTAAALISYDRNQISLLNTNSPIKNDFTHVTSGVDMKIDEKSRLSLTAHYSQFMHDLKYTDSLIKYLNEGRVFGLNTQYSTGWGDDHSLLLGAEFTEDSGSLETKSTDYSVFPAVVRDAGWNRRSQNTTGVYSQYEYTGWKQYLPMAGIRYDTNSNFGSAVSPRLGLSYLSSENTTIYASIGSGFRAPVFNETDIQGFGKVGRRDLKPERTITSEIGLKSIYLSAQNTFSIFKEDISQKIDLTAVAGSSLVTYENSGTTTITGAELDGAYKLASRFRVFYNAIMLRAVNGAGARIDRIAERKYVLGANWILSDWVMDFVLIHESDVFFFNSNTAIESDAEGRLFLPSTTTANLQLKYQFTPKTSVVASIDNLTDSKSKEIFSPYIVQEGLFLPGRTYSLKLNSQF